MTVSAIRGNNDSLAAVLLHTAQDYASPATVLAGAMQQWKVRNGTATSYAGTSHQ